MEKKFVKIQSIKDIIIFTTFILSGALLIILPTGASINVMGYILVGTGVILALLLKNGYKDTADGKRYTRKDIFFPKKMKAELVTGVANNPESIDLSELNKTNEMRVEMFYSQEAGKAFVQLFEYVPYKYEPRTNVIEYEINRVSKFIK